MSKWNEWRKVENPELAFTEVIYEKKYHEELGGGVARVAINRPDTLNSFDTHTVKEVCLALIDASDDPTIGVIVLTGTGDRAFCTGGDVKWETEGTLGYARGSRWIFLGGEPCINDFLVRCRKPVIAAVKGYAIGGGHHLAYQCDITIAAENAVFGQTGPKIGSPADGFMVAYSTRVVGAKKGKEIWMLTRQYTAQEALEMGLVNKVVSLEKFDREVDKWCEEILDHSPSCEAMLKACFDNEIDELRGSLNLGRLGNFIAPDFFEGPEIEEAQQAFLEKRKTDFWSHLRPMIKEKLEKDKME